MKPLQKCAKYETCAICSGFIFCTFFETTLFFFNFEINEYFLFFFFILFYLFIFFWGGGGGGGGWGWGVAVEVILEDFISEIESFHIIYFYFHRSITQKLNLSQ